MADGPRSIAHKGHRTNLAGVPTSLLASTAFNDDPVPLHIAGTWEGNPHLFARLQGVADAQEAGLRFQEYMEMTFGTRGGEDGSGARRFRASYLRLLKGWGFDSNGPEGAVLKGWVESRFGIPPTYHKAVISRVGAPAWATYVEEKMSSRFHNNSIHLQLDLLYEFCQWSLCRFFTRDRRHLTLYRGTNDFNEHQVVSREHRDQAVIRLNNLVSFTTNRDIAGEFGDYILEAQIPTVKLLFFNELLPMHPLRGEAEYLAVGGDYRVRVGYF
ncbi:MAG: NAD(+)--dinitrogen-reductase ADP-D-ribosyltransferase [Pseudomonadota bacterium]